MKKELKVKKNLKNIEGKRLIEKTKLEYSKEIIEILKNNPEELGKILNQLEISEKRLMEYLSGEKHTDIVFYDQAFSLLTKKKTKNE